MRGQQLKDMGSRLVFLGDQALLRVVLEVLRLPNQLGQEREVPFFVQLQRVEEAVGGVGGWVGGWVGVGG